MDEFKRPPRKNIDIDEVVRLYAEGFPLIQIARRFETTHTTIGDRLKRRGITLRGRGEALRVLWRGMPAREKRPAIPGVTPQTKTFISGSIIALRSVGLSDQANELERDAARAHELAVKHNVVLHNPLADTGSMT